MSLPENSWLSKEEIEILKVIDKAETPANKIKLSQLLIDVYVNQLKQLTKKREGDAVQ